MTDDRCRKCNDPVETVAAMVNGLPGMKMTAKGLRQYNEILNCKKRDTPECGLEPPEEEG